MDNKLFHFKPVCPVAQANGLFVVATTLFAGFAFAATPDAGQTIQTIDPARLTLPKVTEPAVDIRQHRPTISTDTSVKIPVSSFNITGSAIYSEADLQPLVQEGISKELTLAEIEALAARITQHYRSHGYLLANAYLPAQDIQAGKVEIAILEGKYGVVDIRSDGVLATIPMKVSAGEVVDIAPLERGLLLLSDTPGVEVKSTLKPGASVGTSDLVVDVTPGKRFSGSIDLDNYGNRVTGQNRLGATVNVNNPTGHGDVFTFRGITSGGLMNYGRIGYQLPVNSYGTKIGVAYSGMGYKLGKEFSSLAANGDAKIATLFAAHPIIRSRITNLSAQISFDGKRIEDRIDSVSAITSKTAQVLSGGLSGDHRDNIGGVGITGFSASMSLGNLNINSLAAKATDDLTARSGGHYGKLSFNALRLQSITDATTLYASYTGQFATKNLDSSEKFSLGGAYGVRAYPTGEASADEAHLITVELRRTLADGLQLVGFVDAAHAKLNENLWAAATSVNHRTLSDAGFGVNWSHQDSFVVHAFYAHKLGAEKATSDTDHSDRFWVQAVKSF